MTPEEKAVLLKKIQKGFREHIPHNQALQLELIDFGPDYASVQLPFAEHLVGNPETRVLHGGVITTLMDATCGASVMMKRRAPVPIATLDLRIDYLRPATPDLDVICYAQCYRLTEHVAFVRGEAFHPEQQDRAIATAAATFVVGTAGKAIVNHSSSASPTKD
jgi:uncharacterized protein (TIGR00369 family)